MGGIERVGAKCRVSRCARSRACIGVELNIGGFTRDGGLQDPPCIDFVVGAVEQPHAALRIAARHKRLESNLSDYGSCGGLRLPVLSGPRDGERAICSRRHRGIHAVDEGGAGIGFSGLIAAAEIEVRAELEIRCGHSNSPECKLRVGQRRTSRPNGSNLRVQQPTRGCIGSARLDRDRACVVDI